MSFTLNFILRDNPCNYLGFKGLVIQRDLNEKNCVCIVKYSVGGGGVSAYYDDHDWLWGFSTET